MASNTFLHLTTKQAWEDALKVGVYSLSTKGKTLEEVGFIHGSFADQVEEVAGFVFAGSTEELVVLHLKIDKLESHGIVVRAMTQYPSLTDCLRISIGTPAENERLLAVLDTFHGATHA